PALRISLSLRPDLRLCDSVGDLSLYSLHLGVFLCSAYFYSSFRSSFCPHLHFPSFCLSPHSHFHFHFHFHLFLHSSFPLPLLHCERNLYQNLDPLCCLPLACERLLSTLLISLLPLSPFSSNTVSGILFP